MNNKCLDCVHAPICKYVDEFENTIGKAEALLEGGARFFSVAVTCRLFRSAKNSASPQPNSKRTLNEFYDIISQSPCSGCPVKPDLSKGIQVGDTACDWCRHNPFKMTCR